MALSANALTTLAAAKTSLQIPQDDTSKDSLIELLIESMSAAAESYCSRALARRVILGEPHEVCGRKFTLDQYPAAGLAKIVLNGSEIALDGVELDSQAGIVKLPLAARGAALVDYTAGLCARPEETPRDIQLAIWKWLEDVLSRESGEGISREQLGDYVVDYSDRNGWPPPIVCSLLEIYRAERL
ncbi:MAG: phage head-tail connector protein [Elusimicrobiales bacterium]